MMNTQWPQQSWPPNYFEVYRIRQEYILRMRHYDYNLMIGTKEYYKDKPAEWIEHWVQTYDPRLAMEEDKPPNLPFILFERQREFIDYLYLLLKAQEGGLVEKSREMGATWLCCAFSVWLWLYRKGAAIGWGSREKDLVDNLGDHNSIFEKMRIIIRGLPPEMLPKGFNPKVHTTYMRIINSENGSTITGDIGDNIGRGGRSLIYFVDEAAHLEHPEFIEAALSENTRCQVDVSSVSGFGTLFERRRDVGVDWAPGQSIVKGRTNVFVFDWSEDPRKSKEWYSTKRQKAEDEGLLHVFKQEIDRDYAASMAGIIIPGEYVNAAIDAHVKLGFDDTGGWSAALDVADDVPEKLRADTRKTFSGRGGGDANAFTLRKGVVLKSVDEWGQRDTGFTTRRAIDACRMLGPVTIQYDAVGVGAGVRSEYNRLKEDNLVPAGITMVPWHAGAKVLWPERRVIDGDKQSPLNQDFYQNFKAQAWWALRRRFELTYRAVSDKFFTYDPNDLISIPSTIPLLRKLCKELSQPCMVQSTSLKLLVDKKPDGSKSPNIADAVVMNYFPARSPLPRITDTMLSASRLPQVPRPYLKRLEETAPDKKEGPKFRISDAALKRSRRNG
jgi:hypothetical protein